MKANFHSFPVNDQSAPNLTTVLKKRNGDKSKRNQFFSQSSFSQPTIDVFIPVSSKINSALLTFLVNLVAMILCYSTNIAKVHI